MDEKANAALPAWVHPTCECYYCKFARNKGFPGHNSWAGGTWEDGPRHLGLGNAACEGDRRQHFEHIAKHPYPQEQAKEIEEMKTGTRLYQVAVIRNIKVTDDNEAVVVVQPQVIVATSKQEATFAAAALAKGFDAKTDSVSVSEWAASIS